jgi:hypothetical protein
MASRTPWALDEGKFNVMDLPILKAVIVTAAACLLWVKAYPVRADDDIDLMLRLGRVPPDRIQSHGYSDFTDPLGRFMDLLAAGAFPEARRIQPEACAAWLTTRQTSALTGKFWVWNTEINLDTICAHP